jgi:hypothetical protein
MKNTHKMFSKVSILNQEMWHTIISYDLNEEIPCKSDHERYGIGYHFYTDKHDATNGLLFGYVRKYNLSVENVYSIDVNETYDKFMIPDLIEDDYNAIGVFQDNALRQMILITDNYKLEEITSSPWEKIHDS